MQVEVFSDVVCPWCYIGKRRFEQALDGFAHADQVSVTYRSFQLDPSTPVEVTGSVNQRLADKYGVPLAQAEAMNQQVTEVAAGVGLEFHLDRAHPANTFDAHRVLHLAAEHGKQAEAKERLLRAYFVEGRHVGDRDTLAALAAGIGLDADLVREALGGDTYAEAVRADLALARSLGITAVPFFVIDRTYGISGAQEAAVLRQALEQAWSESHPLTMVGAAPGADATGGCDDGSCTV